MVGRRRILESGRDAFSGDALTTNANLGEPALPPLPNPRFQSTLPSMPVMEPPVAGAEPQSTTTPEGAAQAQGQPFDASKAIEQMTDAAEMGSILFGNATTPAAPANAEPQSPASGDPPAGNEPLPQGAGAEPPQQEPEPTPQDPQAAQPLERISLKSLHPDDRQLVANAKEMVRSGKAATFADAVLALTKTEEAPAQQPPPTAEPQAGDSPPTQPAAAPAPSVEQDASVATLAANIASLREQRAQAVTDYDRPAEIALTSQIEDALAQLSEAKAAAILAARETSAQQKTLNDTIEAIYVKHPESEDNTSYFSYLLGIERQAYEQAHGPIEQHPSQLAVLADKVAAKIAASAPAQGPQPNAAPPATAAPRQQARPLGTAAPGSAAAVRPSPDQVQTLLQSDDAEFLRSALFGPA